MKYIVVLIKFAIFDFILYYRFTNLFIGFPGKAHDARVLKNSRLYEQACNGLLFPDVSVKSVVPCIESLFV